MSTGEHILQHSEGSQTPRELRIKRFNELRKLFCFTPTYREVLEDQRFPETVLVRYVLIYAAKMSGKDEEYTSNGYLKRIFKRDHTSIGYALLTMTDLIAQARRHPERYERFLALVDTAIELERTGAVSPDTYLRIHALPSGQFNYERDIPHAKLPIA